MRIACVKREREAFLLDGECARARHVSGSWFQALDQDGLGNFWIGRSPIQGVFYLESIGGTRFPVFLQKGKCKETVSWEVFRDNFRMADPP